MSDVNAELQNVIQQCESFLSSLSPRKDEIESIRAGVDNACEFSLSGSIVPASLAQDLMAVERAYCQVSTALAMVEEGKILRKKLVEMIKSAAIRASGQSSQDKRTADAEFITGKFGVEQAMFEAFFKYCEKKLDSIQMRYYTVRAALTSIEQDLRIGGTAGMGTRQLLNSVDSPSKSNLADSGSTGGTKPWGSV